MLDDDNCFNMAWVNTTITTLCSHEQLQLSIQLRNNRVIDMDQSSAYCVHSPPVLTERRSPQPSPPARASLPHAVVLGGMVEAS